MTEPQTYPNRERFFQGLSTFLSSAMLTYNHGHFRHMRKLYVQCALAGKGYPWVEVSIPLVVLHHYLDLQERGMDAARVMRRVSMELERLLELQHVSGAREGTLDELGSEVTLDYMRFEDGNVDAPTTMVSWLEDTDRFGKIQPRLSHDVHICGSVHHVKQLRDRIAADLTWRFKEIEAAWRQDPKTHFHDKDQVEAALEDLKTWIPGYRQMRTNP